MKPHQKLIVLYSALFLILVGCRQTYDFPATTTPTALRLAAAPSHPIQTPTMQPGLPTPTVARQNPTLTPTAEPVIVSLPDLPQGQYLLYAFEDYRTEKSYPGIISTEGVHQGYLTEYRSDFARLSPDKQWLAFVYPGSEGIPHLLNLQTHQLTPASTTDLYCSRPSWSPDSRALVLTCLPLGTLEPNDIYVLDLQDGSLDQLTDCAHDAVQCDLAAWSPDVKWIAYDRDIFAEGAPDRSGFHFIDTACLAEPSTCPKIDIQTYQAYSPYAWSPDSRYLAGVRSRPTSAEVFTQVIRIFEVSESSMQPYREIEVSSHQMDSLAWSPDGKWLAYSDLTAIYLLSLESGESSKIFSGRLARVLEWIRRP